MQTFLNLMKINAFSGKYTRYMLILAAVFAFSVATTLENIHAQQPSDEQAQEEQTEETSEQSSEEKASDSAEADEESTEEAAVQEDNTLISLWQWHAAGDFWMYILDAFVVVTFMIVFERIYYYSVTKVSKKSFQQEMEDAIQSDGLSGAKGVIQQHEGQQIAGILGESISISGNDPDSFSRNVERESSNLIVRAERGLSVLAMVSTVAPLVGFLGTVAGMYSAFDSIANADTVNAKVVAGGIKTALVTTMYGLIAAIPAMVAFQLFNNTVNGYATKIEQASNLVYKELVKLTGKGASSGEGA